MWMYDMYWTVIEQVSIECRCGCVICKCERGMWMSTIIEQVNMVCEYGYECIICIE